MMAAVRRPVIGDIVYFAFVASGECNNESKIFPAIVVAVRLPPDLRVDVVLFSTGNINHLYDVPYSPIPRPMHWSWIAHCDTTVETKT